MSELKLAFNKKTKRNHIVQATDSIIEYDFGALNEKLRIDKLRNISNLIIPENAPDFGGGAVTTSLQDVLDNLVTPDQITGLYARYECGDYFNTDCYEDSGATDECEDTNICLVWKDSQGSKNLIVAANGPTYQLPDGGDAGTPGGKGRLEFDGTDDVLAAVTAADWTFLHNGSGATVIVVAKTTNEESGFILDTTNGGVGIGFYIFNSDAGGDEGMFSMAIRNGSGNIVVCQVANSFPVAEWHIGEGNWITGSNGQIWVDGCFVEESAATGAASASAAAIPLTLAKFGATFDSTKLAAIFVYNKILSAVERRQLMAYIGLTYAIPVGNIACIGDSITALGNGITSWVTKLQSLLGGLWSTTNKGLSGTVIDDMYNDQWLAAVKFLRYNWCTVLGGVNDIVNTSDDAATIFARLQIMLDEIITYPGMRLVLCTILPWKSTKIGAAWTQDKQDVTDAYNILIRQYALTNPDNVYLIDFYNLMGDESDLAKMKAEFTNDNYHPNQMGADFMSNKFAETILEVGLF